MQIERYMSDEVVVCTLMVAQIGMGIHITEVVVSVTIHTVINYVENKHRKSR